LTGWFACQHSVSMFYILANWDFPYLVQWIEHFPVPYRIQLQSIHIHLWCMLCLTNLGIYWPKMDSTIMKGNGSSYTWSPSHILKTTSTNFSMDRNKRLHTSQCFSCFACFLTICPRTNAYHFTKPLRADSAFLACKFSFQCQIIDFTITVCN